MAAQIESKAVDPVKFTRERLVEIADVWTEFAKAKAQPLVEKTQKRIRELRERTAKQAPDNGSGPRVEVTSSPPS